MLSEEVAIIQVTRIQKEFLDYFLSGMFENSCIIQFNPELAAHNFVVRGFYFPVVTFLMHALPEIRPDFSDGESDLIFGVNRVFLQFPAVL